MSTVGPTSTSSRPQGGSSSGSTGGTGSTGAGSTGAGAAKGGAAPTGSAPTGAGATGAAKGVAAARSGATTSGPTGSAPKAAQPTTQPVTQPVARPAGASASAAGGSSATGAATTASTPSGPRPAAGAPSRPAGQPALGGPRARRVKLTVSRVDPWSAMKMSFLISVALGIAGVVMVAVLWMILSGMGVFTEVNRLVGTIFQDSSDPFDIMDFLGFGRVLSLSIVIGVIDVVLMTALSTLGAFLYNICSALVGGLQLTLTDD